MVIAILRNPGYYSVCILGITTHVFFDNWQALNRSPEIRHKSVAIEGAMEEFRCEKGGNIPVSFSNVKIAQSCTRRLLPMT